MVQHCAALFVDPWKAFNDVDHNKLLFMSCADSAYSWFKSYLPGEVRLLYQLTTTITTTNNNISIINIITRVC